MEEGIIEFYKKIQGAIRQIPGVKTKASVCLPSSFSAENRTYEGFAEIVIELGVTEYEGIAGLFRRHEPIGFDTILQRLGKIVGKPIREEDSFAAYESVTPSHQGYLKTCAVVVTTKPRYANQIERQASNRVRTTT